MLNRIYLVLALSYLLLACGPAQAATQGPRTLTLRTSRASRWSPVYR